MKKLFTLLTALFCFATASNAQRMLDMEAKLVSLTPNKVGLNENFEIKAYYKNAGPNATKITDTVIYWYSYNGQIISIGSGSIFYRIQQKAMAVNDTTQITRTIAWTNYPDAPADSTKNFCFHASIMNTSNDSAKDNNTANQNSCLPMTRKAKFAAGVEAAADYVEKHVASVYPNPVQNAAIFNIDLKNNADVTIRVYDLTGKLVIEEKKGQLAKGNHEMKIHTDHLQNGVYIYMVAMGDQTESDKMMISRQ